jgi:hypothetical protein
LFRVTRERRAQKRDLFDNDGQNNTAGRSPGGSGEMPAALVQPSL